MGSSTSLQKGHSADVASLNLCSLSEFERRSFWETPILQGRIHVALIKFGPYFFTGVH